MLLLLLLLVVVVVVLLVLLSLALSTLLLLLVVVVVFLLHSSWMTCEDGPQVHLCQKVNNWMGIPVCLPTDKARPTAALSPEGK